MNNLIKNTLLIELLTEELPPKALKNLAAAFAQNIFTSLADLELIQDINNKDKQNIKHIDILATPRRLAIIIQNVLALAPAKQITTRLMPLHIALKNNLPTPALIKKLQSLGLDANSYVDKLKVINDGKQDYAEISYIANGANLEQVLQNIIEESINKLPVPKLMSYQLDNNQTVNFVRPAHSLICLHGDKIIPANILGLQASNTTTGHRFLSNNRVITIAHADDYINILEQNKVIVNYENRLAIIKQQLIQKAGGAEVLMPDNLLEEVNSLVEYPCVYAGEFEDKFLDIPDECLILTMQTHQKYFALKRNGRLINKFLFVSNMDIENPINIISGNEKVIRPRLSDAEFFYNEDKKHSLVSRVPQLENIIYHNKLGNQRERYLRVDKIIMNVLHKQQEANLNDYYVAALESARISKADLLTNMVGEFPELQGIMGYYYAKHENLPSEVALAIKEHYKPRFAGDELPQGTAAIILALADKLETLVGMWGIGLKPTGEKDPYALRRHALGILRILFEQKLNLDLKQLIEDTSQVFSDIKDYKESSEEIYNFCIERLANYLYSQYGYDIQLVDAVLNNPYKHNQQINFAELANNLWQINSFYNQVLKFRKYIDYTKNTKFTYTHQDENRNITQKTGEQHFNEQLEKMTYIEDIEQIIIANKRIHNIIKNYLPTAHNFNLDISLLNTVEQELYAAFTTIIASPNYLFELGKLAQPLANFFAKVMVNDPDETIRNNRIALLIQIASFCNQDFCIAKL